MTNIILAIALLLPSTSHAGNDKDTELLVSTVETVIRKDGHSTHLHERVERIETEAGRMKLANIKVHFYKSMTKFKLVEAYSLTKGAKTPVRPASVQFRNADQGTTGLSDLTEAVIPFQNLNVGSEIRLKYQLLSEPVIKGLFSDFLMVSNETLAKTETYTYISEVPLFSSQVNPSPLFSHTSSSSPKQYKVVIKPTARAYDMQGLQEDGVFYTVSTASGWGAVQAGSAGLYSAAYNAPLPPKYAAILEQVKAEKNPKKLLDSVSANLAKTITYSGNWQTVQGKFQPQPMSRTGQTGKGDCKDYTTAMVAILRKLGYEAHPFLTFRSSVYQGEEYLTRLSQIANPLYFNHVIVHMKDKTGKSWWVDPTNPYVQAESIMPDILGNFGLLLDGKAQTVTFLPKENGEPANFRMTQTLAIGADNAVSGQSTLTMSTSSYNTIGTFERLYGPEAISRIFSFMLNPASQKTKVEVAKSPKDPRGYDLKYYGPDWVKETPKLSKLTLFHPVVSYSRAIELRKGIDLGEPGKTEFTTLIRGKKVVDSIDNHCILRSKWMDVDRLVENKEDRIEVTDLVTVKKRFIPKSEADGRIFKSFLSDLSACIGNAEIVTHMDESLQTPQYKEEMALRGPPLEKMTDADADRLDQLTGPRQSGRIKLKLLRYYQKKLLASPGDALAHFRIGTSIAGLGYISGTTYGPEYLEEAVQSLEKAVQYASPEEYPKYQSQKISYLLYQKKLDDAIKSFQALYTKAPKSFHSFIAAARIARERKKMEEAEKWARASESLVTHKDQRLVFSRFMSDLLEDQNKIAEAVKYRQIVAEEDPENAWNWHNLALLYMDLKNYDKVIELETKALEKTEFGMANKTISEAYHRKHIAMKTAKGRTPSNSDDDVEFLLKAVKYDSGNVKALVDLGLHYMNEANHKKDKHLMTKARSYMEQAAKAEPNHPLVRTGFALLGAAEKNI